MKTSNPKEVLPALLAGWVLFVALAVYCARGGVIDDSFISFRYAENFADGHGLVFNPGEPPVEGYSNFLWVVLLSLCYGAGFDTVAASRILGTVCGLGIVAGVALLSRRQGSPPVARALAVAAAATAPALGVYAISGMETLLYSFLWVLFLALFLLEEKGARVPVSGLAGALICLTRPEGFLVLGVFVLLRMLQGYGDRGRRWFAALWLAEILVVFVPFLLWRYWYYGYLLPMPVYAKATGEYVYRGLRQFLGGGRYLLGFAKTYGGGGVFLVLTALCLRRLLDWRPIAKGSPLPAATVLALFFVWYLAFVINVGGDWMPQYRFLVPLLPVMYLLAVNPEILPAALRQYAAVPPAILLFFNLLQLPLVINSNLPNTEPYVQYAGISISPDLAQRYQQVGRRYEGKSLATTECGMLPYYSGLRTLDMMGLNDEFIGMAFHRGRGLYDTDAEVYGRIVEYVLGQRPDLIHVGGGLPNNATYYQELMDSEEFKSLYLLDQALASGAGNFYVRRMPAGQP